LQKQKQATDVLLQLIYNLFFLPNVLFLNGNLEQHFEHKMIVVTPCGKAGLGNEFLVYTPFAYLVTKMMINQKHSEKTIMISSI
jgi:hypothetical protein